MQQSKRTRSFGTHDGTFHADEVTACALLLFFDLIDRDKILRTRELELLEQCEFVCDVGGLYDPEQKLFDHHQAHYLGELSSAGMVLKFLKEKRYIAPNAYDYLNQSLIMGVDAHDTGRDPQIVGYCSFSNVVSNFTPIGYQAGPREQDEAFYEALDFVLGHLKRLWGRFEYMQSYREDMAAAMASDKPYLIFERALPWLELFFELGGERHPALFVIMPTGSHWKLRGIPPSLEERMKVRCPLPKAWCGLMNSELEQESGIEGAVFCHKGRFISVWETKKAAIQALEYTLKQQEVP